MNMSLMISAIYDVIIYGFVNMQVYWFADKINIIQKLSLFFSYDDVMTCKRYNSLFI